MGPLGIVGLETTCCLKNRILCRHGCSILNILPELMVIPSSMHHSNHQYVFPRLLEDNNQFYKYKYAYSFTLQFLAASRITAFLYDTSIANRDHTTQRRIQIHQIPCPNAFQKALCCQTVLALAQYQSSQEHYFSTPQPKLGILRLNQFILYYKDEADRVADQFLDVIAYKNGQDILNDQRSSL